MIRSPRTPVPRPPGRRIALAAPLLLLAWGIACDRPEPESVVEIIGATTPCSGCRIELGPPLELRAEKPGEAVLATSPTDVTIDAQGRYWVAERHQPARVYDASGTFLSAVGKSSSVPDELDAPKAFLALPGDSMLVFDNAQRAFVVDSLFRTIRTLQVPGNLMPASADGWPATFLLTGPVKDSASAGQPLHTVSAEQPDIKVLNSFGPSTIPSTPSTSAASFQRVTPAKDGGYWAADILQYRISKFTKDGTLIHTIERAPDWFAMPSAESIGTPNAPPPPIIFDIWQSSDGLLWVFGRVAGKNWKDAWPKLASDTARIAISAMHFEKMYGTVIEVLDPITHDVVSTTKLDDYVANVLPNGNVAVYAVDSANVAHLSIRRLSLTR